MLSFREYLGYVKSFHPVAKQARLNIDIGQAELLKARGAFDPKIEVDYDRKKFKGTEYWDRLNTTFKVPTWYGIELKGTFEQVSGEFTNPDEFLPDDGRWWQVQRQANTEARNGQADVHEPTERSGW